MPRMGKTEEDWNGLKLGFLKTVQPNTFSKLIPAACNFRRHICLSRVSVLSFTCNFFAYFKFHSDLGRVIGKIKQNKLDCRDTAVFPPQVEKKIVRAVFQFHPKATNLSLRTCNADLVAFEPWFKYNPMMWLLRPCPLVSGVTAEWVFQFPPV